MNPNETINVSRDFLASNSTSLLVRWVMVIFLLFCGIPQKTVAAITNYTERQVRNIRDRFENSNGDFPREGKKRGRKRKCIVPKNLTLNTFKQLMGYGRLTEKKEAIHKV